MHNVNTLRVNIINLDLDIVVVYKQPLVSFNVFEEIINSQIRMRGRAILVGDVNINLLSNSNHVKKYTDSVMGSGFHILNKITKKYATRVASRNRGNNLTTSHTIIDHVLTNIIDFNYELYLNDNPLSDHREIQITFGRNESNNFITEEETINISKLDFNKYNNEISNLNDELNLAINFNQLINVLETCRSNNTQIRAIKRELNPNKPWISDQFINLIRQRKRCYILLRKSPSNYYLQMKFKFICESIKNQRIVLRSNYFASVINSNVDKPKLMWLRIKHALFNRKGNNNTVSAIKLDNNQTLTDKYAISNKFNVYFCDIGKSLHDRIVDNYPCSNSLITVQMNMNSLFLFPTTDIEIEYNITLLKPSNSLDDCISANSLKKHRRLIAPILSRLINECFNTGQFPSELKCSRIIPVFKSGCPLNLGNYRPISILPSLSKLFEKSIFSKYSEIKDSVNTSHKII